MLLERLQSRKSESLDQLKWRLDRADYELNQAPNFDRWVRNDDLQKAVAEVAAIADKTGATARTRSKKDFEWITNYARGLQDEAKRLYDQLHHQKG
jgi:guanylate kinase